MTDNQSLTTSTQLVDPRERQSLVTSAVDSGIRQYLAETRQSVDGFVDSHFSFKGALELNRKAFGYDMLRAPANLAWTPLNFVLKGVGKGAGKLGFQQFSDKMSDLPAGLRTDIEQELEWRVYTEFLGLPCQQADREYQQNRLLETILAQPQLHAVFSQSLAKIAQLANDEAGKASLINNLQRYVDSRKAAAELSAILVGAAVGYAANQTINVGALGLGKTLAGILAYHSAVSSFAMGNTLGGLYYAIVPVSVSKTALVLSTGGVAALLGVVAAFAGVIADPLQRHLGLHQKKLHRLVDCLEQQLTSDSSRELKVREAYITRVVDLADILMTLSTVK